MTKTKIHPALPLPPTTIPTISKPLPYHISIPPFDRETPAEEQVLQARQVDRQNEDRIPIAIGGYQFGYGVGPGQTLDKIISQSRLSEL
jgi:hypothetical protein